VRGVSADIGDPLAPDRDAGGADLAAVDIDQPAVLDHEVGLRPAQRDVDELGAGHLGLDRSGHATSLA